MALLKFSKYRWFSLILPDTSKVLFGELLQIPNLLLQVSNNKFDDWFIGFVPFRNYAWLFIKLVVPIPPRETVKVPKVTLEAFREVKPLPFTDTVPEIILEAFKSVNCEPFPITL